MTPTATQTLPERLRAKAVFLETRTDRMFQGEPERQGADEIERLNGEIIRLKDEITRQNGLLKHYKENVRQRMWMDKQATEGAEYIGDQ